MNPKDFKAPPSHYVAKWGFVALLDALGARTFTGDDIDRFMDQHGLFLRILEETVPVLHAAASPANPGAPGRPATLVFGDTIAVLWPALSRHPYALLREVQEFSAALSYAVSLGLIAGLKLRGAIACGEYYTEAGVAIGPAVAEAAEWYERAQWIGVIATPNFTRIIDELVSDPSGADHDPMEPAFQPVMLPLRREFARMFWPKYTVPLKADNRQALAALNWPYGLFVLGPDITRLTGKHVSDFFRHRLDAFPRPKAAQPKYENTWAFYEACVRHTTQIERSFFNLKLQRAMTSDIPLAWFDAFFEKYGRAISQNKRPG